MNQKINNLQYAACQLSTNHKINHYLSGDVWNKYFIFPTCHYETLVKSHNICEYDLFTDLENARAFYQYDY